MIHKHDWHNPDLKLSHVHEMCILDPITYKDWIMAVMCNIPDKDLNRDNVRLTMLALIDCMVEEAAEIARKSDESVLEYVKKGRSLK